MVSRHTCFEKYFVRLYCYHEIHDTSNRKIFYWDANNNNNINNNNINSNKNNNN